MKQKIFTLPFRRKREGKTDYKTRLTLLKSNKPRLVIRKSNKHIQAQLIKYSEKGDIVQETVHSRGLLKYGWKLNCGNLPAAYLVGLLIGKKAKGKQAILDLGLQTPRAQTKLFAVLKGALDGGLKINFSDTVLPSEDRIIGRHISEFAKLVTKSKDKYEGLFSSFKKNDSEKVEKYFEKTKKKILDTK